MDAVKKEYPCTVTEVYSGDDLICMVDLGVENLWKRVRVRLHGVDTPNAVKSGDETEAGKVRSYVRTLARNKRGRLTVVQQKDSSWVCGLIVESPDGIVDVNQQLIAQGYVFKRGAQ